MSGTKWGILAIAIVIATVISTRWVYVQNDKVDSLTKAFVLVLVRAALIAFSIVASLFLYAYIAVNDPG